MKSISTWLQRSKLLYHNDSSFPKFANETVTSCTGRVFCILQCIHRLVFCFVVMKTADLHSTHGFDVSQLVAGALWSLNAGTDGTTRTNQSLTWRTA